MFPDQMVNISEVLKSSKTIKVGHAKDGDVEEVAAAEDNSIRLKKMKTSDEVGLRRVRFIKLNVDDGQ